MKIKIHFVYILFLLLLFSCSDNIDVRHSDIEPAAILKNYRTWWNYTYENIHLSENYVPLDTSSNIISRESFLKSLSSGDFVAFRINTIDSTIKYKLFKLNSSDDDTIKSEVKRIGIDELKKYKMEGTLVPNFNFTDLNGNVYNRENTKGKIVILKCWFIHCAMCVQEIPALNEVVKEYKNRKDILFLSLAYNSKQQLKEFLGKTKFDYAVISIDEKYIEDTLQVNEYPTHFIINRNGQISKVAINYRDMVSALKREILK